MQNAAFREKTTGLLWIARGTWAAFYTGLNNRQESIE